MTFSTQAPVLFISHGAPTFALEPSHLGPLLNKLGQTLSGIRAVLVVSPHWQTRGAAQVMSAAAPETMHDFGGFPEALYQLQYPAPGAPELAQEVADLLAKAGWPVQLDAKRPLDHGAWVPLMHLLPKADVPVLQVSMPIDLNPVTAYQLGQALTPLRKQGVLVLASGSMTHNLREFRYADEKPQDYAIEFTRWVRRTVLDHDANQLLNYRSLAPHAQRAHPTDEHFLPLMVAMGASEEGEQVKLLDGGVDHSVLSMESYAWGVSQ